MLTLPWLGGDSVREELGGKAAQLAAIVRVLPPPSHGKAEAIYRAA
jgi:hypothetical protein